MLDKRKEIEQLIEKAAKSVDSGDAMRFSQAACNATTAMNWVNYKPSDSLQEFDK